MELDRKEGDASLFSPLFLLVIQIVLTRHGN